jgi:hypothetical protein
MNYQELAKRTLNGDPNHTALERLANMLWGLAGEASELKDASYNYKNRQTFTDEAGDIRWYIAGVHSCFGLSEEATTPSEDFVWDLYATPDATIGGVFEALFYSIGKLQESCKKLYFHKKDISNEEIMSGLSLIRAYWEAILLFHRQDRDEVEAANIAKLEKRYPTGFNTADSLARRDVTQ